MTDGGSETMRNFAVGLRGRVDLHLLARKLERQPHGLAEEHPDSNDLVIGIQFVDARILDRWSLDHRISDAGNPVLLCIAAAERRDRTTEGYRALWRAFANDVCRYHAAGEAKSRSAWRRDQGMVAFHLEDGAFSLDISRLRCRRHSRSRAATIASYHGPDRPGPRSRRT